MQGKARPEGSDAVLQALWIPSRVVIDVESRIALEMLRRCVTRMGEMGGAPDDGEEGPPEGANAMPRALWTPRRVVMNVVSRTALEMLMKFNSHTGELVPHLMMESRAALRALMRWSRLVSARTPT